MNGRLEHKIKIEKEISKLLIGLPDYVEKYSIFLSVTKEPKTCLEYLRKIKYFLNHINKKITDITETDINRFFLFIQIKNTNGEKTETSFAYRKLYHTVLSSFFLFLQRNNIINNNPIKYIERPKENDKVEHILLTSKDLNAILNKVETGTSNKLSLSRQINWKERDRAILMLLMNTGMRETALSEINIEDINFEDKTINIIDKGHKHHEYYMNDKMTEVLLYWVDKRNKILNDTEEDALFISNRRSRITARSISNIVKKYSEDSMGKALSPHKLRSAFCSILYEETGDIEFVRDCVGHSNVATTQRYIVKDNNAKKRAADILKNKIG